MIAAARHFHATFLSGWWRWPREHFRVLVGRDSARMHPLRAPFGSYYADPFPWVHGGKTWLFLEEFRYSENRGRLVALPLDDHLQPAGPVFPLNLPPGFHRSYPLIFPVADELLLLPETGAQGTVDLYTCERFPDRWSHRCRLLSGLDAADPTPLHHAGRWWLFVAERARPTDGGHRSLAIYSAAELFQSRWEPHPVNARRLYAGSAFSFGRPAGPFVPSPAGGWLRPMQSSRRYYGESAQWMEIAALTRTDFREQPFTGTHPLVELAGSLSPHHLATAGGIVACDVRDRYRIEVAAPRAAGAAE